MGQARNHAGPDQINGHDDDWNRVRRLLQDRDHATADGDNGIRVALDEARGVAAHQVRIVGRPALVERDFAALDPAEPVQLLFERAHPFLYLLLGLRIRHQNPDPPQSLARLLRARRERPRGRAAEQRDELATLLSITSSARASSLSGTVRPSAFAVLALMANSNFTVCWTGKSAGFSPLRIRPA